MAIKLRSRAAAVGLLALAVFSTAAYAAGYFPGFPITGSGTYCSGGQAGIGSGTGSSTFAGTGAGAAFGQGAAGQSGTFGQPCIITNTPAGPVVVTGGELVPADTALPSGQQPQTVLIPTGLLANMSGTPRNYLDNGTLNIQQRGTGTVTCGTTSGVPSSAYGPDRWGCDTNVTSGAGRTALVTTAALLPTGFSQVNTVFRTSGALLQPVCSIQEIPTNKAIALAGKTVSLSVYAAALAGLAADNSNTITASIITGTGTDQGLGTMTASPAITPAWTGVASPLNQSPMTITTAPLRYAFPATAIPATVTEIAVAFCFTPTATGAGATDGFAFVGAQLEVSPSPTAYEFHDIVIDLDTAQRYFYRINESTTVVGQRAMCAVSTTSLAVCQINFPATMAKAPTMTYTSGFTLTVAAQSSAVVCTVTRTSTTLAGAAATNQGVPIDCTSAAGFGAAGTAAQLYDLGTGSSTGVITASADF